jgi:hypothetical protein
MTDTQQKNAPKGSNGTATRVTPSDSVEKDIDGVGISNNNNRHNGNAKSTTPQKTTTSTHPGSNGDSKDGSATKSGKKRRKVNHGS